MIRKHINDIFLYLYGSHTDENGLPYDFGKVKEINEACEDFDFTIDVLKKYASVINFSIVTEIIRIERKHMRFREELVINYNGLVRIADEIMKEVEKG